MKRFFSSFFSPPQRNKVVLNKKFTFFSEEKRIEFYLLHIFDIIKGEGILELVIL